MDISTIVIHTGGDIVPSCMHFFGRARAPATATSHFDVGLCFWAFSTSTEATVQTTVRIQALSKHILSSGIPKFETDQQSAIVICCAIDVTKPESCSGQVDALAAMLAQVEAAYPGAKRGPLLLCGADKLLPDVFGSSSKQSSCLHAQTSQHACALLCYLRMISLHLGSVGLVGMPCNEYAAHDKPLGLRLIRAVRLISHGSSASSGSGGVVDDPLMEPCMDCEAREGVYVPPGTDLPASVRSYYLSKAVGSTGWTGTATPVPLTRHEPPCKVLAAALASRGYGEEHPLAALKHHTWIPTGFEPVQDAYGEVWKQKDDCLTALVASSVSQPVSEAGTAGKRDHTSRMLALDAQGSATTAAAVSKVAHGGVPTMEDWAAGLLARQRSIQSSIAALPVEGTGHMHTQSTAGQQQCMASQVAAVPIPQQPPAEVAGANRAEGVSSDATAEIKKGTAGAGAGQGKGASQYFKSLLAKPKAAK